MANGILILLVTVNVKEAFTVTHIGKIVCVRADDESLPRNVVSLGILVDILGIM